jgi:hypothetical protein
VNGAVGSTGDAGGLDGQPLAVGTVVSLRADPDRTGPIIAELGRTGDEGVGERCQSRRSVKARVVLAGR